MNVPDAVMFDWTGLGDVCPQLSVTDTMPDIWPVSKFKLNNIFELLLLTPTMLAANGAKFLLVIQT